MAPSIPPEVVELLPADLQAQVPLYDENLQPNLYAADAICIAFAYGAVILRLYSRRLKMLPFGWDDYMIMLALVRSICVWSFLICTRHPGRVIDCFGSCVGRFSPRRS